MEMMRLAAAALTDRDRKLLARLWRAALAAAASVDPDDDEHLGFGVYRGDFHWYWRTQSGMVEEILEERMMEEHGKSAKRRSEGFTDVPF